MGEEPSKSEVLVLIQFWNQLAVIIWDPSCMAHIINTHSLNLTILSLSFTVQGCR